MKCPNCQLDFVPGKMLSQHSVIFRPNKIPFFTLMTQAVPVEALMCPGCGVIGLRGDTEKLRRLLGG